MLRRTIVVAVAVALAISGCASAPATPTRTPLATVTPAAAPEPSAPASPTRAATATAAAAAPALSVPAASPTPPAAAIPSPSATAAIAPVNAGPRCATDLAVRPPLNISATQTSEADLQAAAMLPQERDEVTRLGAVSRYAITVTIDLAGPSLYGSETVTYTNNETVALTDVYFGLYPNAPFNYAQMDAANATIDGRPVTASLDSGGTALRLALPSPLQPGASLAAYLDFTVTVPVTVPGGYAPIIYSDDMLALASWYPIVLMHDAAGWHTTLGPEMGDLVYSPIAFYEVTVTSPVGLVLVTSGLPFGQALDATGRKTQTLRAGPVRDFYMTGSSKFCLASGLAGDTIVNSYYLEGSETAGTRAVEIAVAMMKVLNARAGLYPYREFDVVQSPVRAGGVEYPEIVVISDRYYRRPPDRELDFVVAHETAHQWWYALVGNDQVNEPWLDEALANFSTTLYWEDQYGAQAALAMIQQVLQAPYDATVRLSRDVPADLPVSAYPTQAAYSAMVYDKGALFYVNLRQTLGDDLFFDFLHKYFEAYRYKIAHTSDVQNLAETIGGPAVGPIFKQWVGGSQN